MLGWGREEWVFEKGCPKEMTTGLCIKCWAGKKEGEMRHPQQRKVERYGMAQAGGLGSSGTGQLEDQGQRQGWGEMRPGLEGLMCHTEESGPDHNSQRAVSRGFKPVVDTV